MIFAAYKKAFKSRFSSGEIGNVIDTIMTTNKLQLCIYMINTTDATCEAGFVYLSGATKIRIGFAEVRVGQFLVFYAVFVSSFCHCMVCSFYDL